MGLDDEVSRLIKKEENVYHVDFEERMQYEDALLMLGVLGGLLGAYLLSNILDDYK